LPGRVVGARSGASHVGRAQVSSMNIKRPGSMSS
jgi:hypothetical protein